MPAPRPQFPWMCYCRVLGPRGALFLMTFAASRLHCRADARDPLLRSARTQGFTAGPVYERCSPMLGSLKTSRTYERGTPVMHRGRCSSTELSNLGGTRRLSRRLNRAIGVQEKARPCRPRGRGPRGPFASRCSSNKLSDVNRIAHIWIYGCGVQINWFR